MSKHSFEFKKQVVTEYLSGSIGGNSLARKYGLSKGSVWQWINAYKEFGDAGLKKTQHKSYSFEKKLYIVELYLSSEISYQDLALQEGISYPTVIATWVSRFRTAGPDALRPRTKGRKRTLNKPTSKAQNKSIQTHSVDTSAEHVKELETELFNLRIENAFLKELRRLRLEDEAKMRERLESLTVSEDSSN